MKKPTKNDIGRRCLTRWDDTGITEGLIVGVEKDYFKIFDFNDCDTQTVDFDQLVRIGSHLTLPPDPALEK